MTLTDLLADLKARIGPACIATDDQLLVWLNESYMYMVDQIIQENPDYFTTSDTTNLVANQFEYQMPPNASQISLVYANFTGTWRRLTPFQDIGQIPNLADPTQFPQYTEVDPKYYITGGKIGIFPIPLQNVTAGLKVWFTFIPTDLGANDTPAFNSKYHRLISLGAYPNYLDLDDQHQAAEVKLNRFEQRVQEMVESIAERQIDEPKSIEIVEDRGLYVDSVYDDGVL